MNIDHQESLEAEVIRLRERATELERGMETGDNLLSQCGRLLETAEARVTELERERDFLLSDPDMVSIKEWIGKERERAERYKTALQEIMLVRWTEDGGGYRDLPTVRNEIRGIARDTLKETAPRYTMDQGAIIPTNHKPHTFVGRLDRWCEVCDLPDRHPVHTLKETTQ